MEKRAWGMTETAEKSYFEAAFNRVIIYVFRRSGKSVDF